MGSKLLIIGGSGELGSQIIKQSRHSELEYTYYSNKDAVSEFNRYQLNITDYTTVKNLISKLRPALVINASVSDRSIEKLEDKNARSAVVEGALNLAEAANESGARSIHISTDLVFDGAEGNYSEQSPVNPLSRYGKYKAEMEEKLLLLDYDLAVVRTSLIISFDPMGHQVSWIVNTIGQNKELRLFTDEYRSPVLGEDLAKAILELSQTDFTGLINIAGPEFMNRYELGSIIAEYYRLDKNLIKPALSKESNLPRPLNCTLDSSFAFNLLNVELREISGLV